MDFLIAFNEKEIQLLQEELSYLEFHYYANVSPEYRRVLESIKAKLRALEETYFRYEN